MSTQTELKSQQQSPLQLSQQPPSQRQVREPRHRHSPRVRRLAREAGIDPEQGGPTGPDGRVRPAEIATRV